MSCALHVGSVHGEQLTLMTEFNISIADVKVEIEELTGILSIEQVLLHDRSELLDDTRLCEFISGDQAVVTLMRLQPPYGSWLSRLSIDGGKLKHAPKWARADRKIVVAAVRENQKAFHYA
eukprot:TRINITY_DN5204_c0_g7_i1.p1 TRINITY_DN5204_c0_g7~~TRINITY_DN5204_c0_g7_i1.p1  ORF type:complete len:121 (-),score=17.06 TRINITY_DN5204_c0_g7_i1:5-367(-)